VEAWPWNRASTYPTKARYSWRIPAFCTTPKLPASFATAVDMEVQRSGRQQPLRILVNVADSLSGLGIIAAVLGVVVTMQALGGPALDIGQKVAAVLVGTFLGILLCYGVVGPLAHHLECLSKAHAEFLQVLRVALAWFSSGASPMVAAEAGRRTIPLDLRPSLEEMEKELRQENIPLTGPARGAGRRARRVKPCSKLDRTMKTPNTPAVPGRWPMRIL
jgi:hypothetical protein